MKEIKTTFSNKSKAADAEWKIKTFKQGKRNTADFMIEFKALAMKADTDELHAIFLLKKNVRQDIIKMILGYPPIVMPETLKEWKVAITSVGQGYDMTTRQVQESPMVIEDNLWTLGNPMTTSRMGSLSASIATNMDTWQRNANRKRRNEKQEHVLNVTRRGILPKTAKESR